MNLDTQAHEKQELSAEEVSKTLEDILQARNLEFEDRRLVLSRLTLQDKVETDSQPFVLEFPALDSLLTKGLGDPRQLRRVSLLEVVLRPVRDRSREQHFQVLARLDVERKVLVAKESLNRDTELSPHHLEWIWKEDRSLQGDLLKNTEDVVGLVAKRPLIKGQVVLLSYFQKKIAIKRGQVVRVNLDLSSISISSHVKALEDGIVGQDIQVLHPVTKKVLQAKVISDSHVQAITN